MPPERPRTNLRPVVAWVVAAVVAVAVASWGVGLVSRSVTDDRPAPLEAAQIQARLDEATSTTTGPTSTTTGSATSSTAPGATTTVAGGAPSTTTTTVSPPPPPPTTAAPAPTTTAAGETRTYNLVGGTAALRFSPSGVTVVFANPASGFDVEIEPENVNGVKVEFESEAHKSRVDGWWDGGPQDRVEERAEDD